MFSREEWETMHTSVDDMILDLEGAKSTEAEISQIDCFVSAETTDQRGRPRINIREDVLREAYRHSGPTELGQMFGVSSRTIRRRGIEQEIVRPGDAVCVEFVTNDGQVYTYYCGNSRPSSSRNTITDEELDEVMRQILNSFPHIGRRMLDGHLRAWGLEIERPRLKEAYLRVHGPTINAFGIRRIDRRIYWVPHTNSLWHHDGQHGE